MKIFKYISITLVLLLYQCQTEKIVFQDRIVYQEKEVTKYIEIEKFILPREIELQKKQLSNVIDFDNLISTIYQAAIDSKSNLYPQQNFVESIDTICKIIIDYIYENSDLYYAEKQRLFYAYQENHTQIINICFDSYKENIIKSPVYLYEPTIIRYPVLSAVESFNNSLATVTSSLINIVLASTLNPVSLGVQASVAVASELNIIEIVLNKVLFPISYILMKNAIVTDHVSGKIKLVSQTRDMITELATVREDYSIEYIRPYQRTFLGIISQTASITIQSNARVKVGFDLNKKFELLIDDYSQTINISLPRPEVLSIETEYSILDIKNKLFVKIDKAAINESMAVSKDTILKRVNNSNIYNDAKKNCTRIINNIYQPVLNMLPIKYDLVIKFL